MTASAGKIKAVFLDRDSTLNVDHGYTHKVEDFAWMPGASEALALFHRHGVACFIVTNQGGIAKGRYGHQEVQDIHDVLQSACEEVGAPLDDIFYSPHHPDFGASLSRKPGSLMVEKALAKHRLDPEQCWMFGDKARDIDCALGAGVRNGVLVEPNAPLGKWVSLPLADRR